MASSPRERFLMRRTPAARALALMLAVALTGAVVPVPEARAALMELPEYELSLRESLEMAMDNNLDIAVQRYNQEVDETGIVAAKSAYDSVLVSRYQEADSVLQNPIPFSGFVVNTSKSRSFNSTWTDPTIWGGQFEVFLLGDKVQQNVSQLQPQYDANFRLTYRQELLRKFGLDVNQAPIQIAQMNHRISQEDFRNIVINVAQLTEFAYWDLVFARADLKVQRQSRALAERLLEMNRAKVEVGTMAPIDITQAEAGVADREEGVILGEANVENAEDVLRQLINPAPDSPLWISRLIPTDSPLFEPITPDMDAALESARQNRPDLERQRLVVGSSGKQEMIDRKNKRWGLELSGNYGTQGLTGRGDICLDSPPPPVPALCVNRVEVDEDLGDALSELTDDAFGSWSVQAQLLIPIGNRAAKAQYASSKLRRQQAEVQMDNVELAAEIDVRTRVRNVVTNIKRVEAAGKNLELQQENVTAEQKKYENGMSTSFLVLQAQDALRTAERRRNLAVIDYNKALVSLEQSKGTLLEARKIDMVHDTMVPGGYAPGSYGVGLTGTGAPGR